MSSRCLFFKMVNKWDSALLSITSDVSKGMSYLHHLHDLYHRDLCRPTFSLTSTGLPRLPTSAQPSRPLRRTSRRLTSPFRARRRTWRPRLY